jgi:hypothetical protein
MEVARRRGRRRKKLLDDLKDRRGYSHLKEEALDRTMWRHRFGGSFGPVVRQITEWMNDESFLQLKSRGPLFGTLVIWQGINISHVTLSYSPSLWSGSIQYWAKKFAHPACSTVFLNLCETAARQILFFIRWGPGLNRFTRKCLSNFFKFVR